MRAWKEIKWDSLLPSILYVLLGIVLLLFPETTARTLGYLVGGVAVLAGAVSMICYLLRDAHENYYRNDFVWGLVGIALGCFIFYKVDLIISMVPFILGLLVLVSGCSKLQDVIDMKRLSYGNWIAMLAVAAVNVIFAVLLLSNPAAAGALLFRLIGAALVFSGISDAFATLLLAKKIKEFQKELEVLQESTFEEMDVR